MELMQRRRELMGMQANKLDTSPVILAKDTRYVNGGTTRTNSGTSITKIYDLPGLVSASDDRYGICYGIVPTTLNYLDGVYKDYWNQTVTTNPDRTVLFSYNVNQAAFTIKTEMLDDCFCYQFGTGQILFAGKNSIYYGHRNISELN